VTIQNLSTGAGVPWAGLSALNPDLPSAPNLVEFGVATNFQFQHLISANLLGVLFNEYQINKIELNFWMDNAPSYTQGNGGVPNTIPSVYIATDPNDSTVPATSDGVMSRGDVQFHSLSKPFTYTFYPKPAISAYVNGLASGYAAPAQTTSFWLDTSAPSNAIEHYGVKMWWRNFSTANSAGLAVRIQPVVYLTCRRIR